MTYILNIGLEPSKNITSRTAQITKAEVLAAVRGAGFRVLGYRESESNTERTAILRVESYDYLMHAVKAGFFHIAVALSQDCIAVWEEIAKTGYLVGPLHHLWGEFNPEYFIAYDNAEDVAQYQDWHSLAFKEVA